MTNFELRRSMDEAVRRWARDELRDAKWYHKDGSHCIGGHLTGCTWAHIHPDHMEMMMAPARTRISQSRVAERVNEIKAVVAQGNCGVARTMESELFRDILCVATEGIDVEDMAVAALKVLDIEYPRRQP